MTKRKPRKWKMWARIKRRNRHDEFPELSERSHLYKSLTYRTEQIIRVEVRELRRKP